MGAAGWRNGVLKSFGKRRGGFDIGEFRWEDDVFDGAMVRSLGVPRG